MTLVKNMPVRMNGDWPKSEVSWPNWGKFPKAPNCSPWDWELDVWLAACPNEEGAALLNEFRASDRLFCMLWATGGCQGL